MPPAQPVNLALEALIREQPDELGPWRAYCDWLLAQGHPRGELMARMLEREAQPNVNAAQSRERDGAIAALVKQLDPELDGGFSVPGAGYRRGFKTRHHFRVFGGQSLAELERQVEAPGLRLLRDVILQLELPLAGAELARAGEVLAGAAFAAGLRQLELQGYDGLAWGRAEHAAFVKLFGACSRLSTFVSRAELPVAPRALELRLTCTPAVAAVVVQEAAQVRSLALTLTELEGAAAALGAPLPELRALRLEPLTEPLLGALLGAPFFRQLTRLDLHLLPQVVPALVGEAPRLLAVPELTLRGLWADSPHAAMIAAAFPRARVVPNMRL